MKKVDVAIIGGGPAGLAAALKANEAGASVLVIERDHSLGGILQQCIHNGFGLHWFKEELSGPEYAQRFIDKLKDTGIEVMVNTMVLEVTKDRIITACSEENSVFQIQAGAVILAMGCRERTRGAINIPGDRPAGVYTAGCTQRLVNMEGYLPGKEVVILGSGDIGLIMARRLTWEGAHVQVVCELMPYSSGLARNIAQCLDDNNIPLRLSTTVTRIHGKKRVEGVTIAQVDERLKPIPGTEEYIPCDTLLLSVGLLPENELTEMAGVQLDRITSGAVVDQNRQTMTEGIFACGNVLHVHDLVDNVSAEAEIAAQAAAKFASSNVKERELVAVKPEGGVRYCVPQYIDMKNLSGETVDIYFRVGKAYKPAEVNVKCGETVIKHVRKPIMTPGEMEKISIKCADITGEGIVVSLMEEKK